jgi:hypothetical protein
VADPLRLSRCGRFVCLVVNFYSPMIGHPPLECLYQLTGPCRTASNVAGFFGAAAYDARLFWASGIATVLGLLLQR